MSFAKTTRQQSRTVESNQDVVFDILKNRRRRQVIQYLKAVEESVTIGDLSEQLAAWENDVPVSDITYKQRKRVYISLHQTHLPKLDDSGVVDYDRRSGTVSLADSIEPYEKHLDLDSSAEPTRRTPLVYGVVSGFGVVSSFALGLFVFSVRPGGLVPIEIGLALLAVAMGVGLFLYQNRTPE